MHCRSGRGGSEPPWVGEGGLRCRGLGKERGHASLAGEEPNHAVAGWGRASSVPPLARKEWGRAPPWLGKGQGRAPSVEEGWGYAPPWVIVSEIWILENER